MKTKNLAEKAAMVPSESEGICVTIANFIRRHTVIELIEHFQTQHALQEEREMKYFQAPGGGASPDHRAAFAYLVNRMISNVPKQRKSKS